jgi:nitrilase
MAQRTSVRAAAVQLAPVFDEPGGTVTKVCAAVAEARARGAELVVFPETFIPYYPYFSFVRPPVQSGAEHLRLYEWAVTVDGPECARLAEAARLHRVVLVVGVNERDHGSLYNTQLVFDADGTLLLRRRKLTPTFHERMIWGQGDGSGLRVVDSAVGRLGALACWEHYNPLARYALMSQHEAIHCAQFPGSMVGQIFADQIEVTIRHHALEAGCFVICSTGTMTPAQVAALTPDPALQGALRGGSFTAIISPEGRHLCPPLSEGEGMLVADLDLTLITKRKRMMDSVGHYARPELLKLWWNGAPQPTVLSGAAPRANDAIAPQIVEEDRHVELR